MSLDKKYNSEEVEEMKILLKALPFKAEDLYNRFMSVKIYNVERILGSYGDGVLYSEIKKIQKENPGLEGSILYKTKSSEHLFNKGYASVCVSNDLNHIVVNLDGTFEALMDYDSLVEKLISDGYAKEDFYEDITIPLLGKISAGSKQGFYMALALKNKFGSRLKKYLPEHEHMVGIICESLGELGLDEYLIQKREY